MELSGALVGHVDLAYLTAHSGEFGIGIERPRWRHGVGLTAGRLLLAYAFEVLKLQEVTATVHAPNLPSHALMRRLGFVEEGEAEPEPYQGAVVAVTRDVVKQRRSGEANKSGWGKLQATPEPARPSPNG